eukprot:951463-Prorocentrum_minimum.AAC.2
MYIHGVQSGGWFSPPAEARGLTTVGRRGRRAGVHHQLAGWGGGHGGGVAHPAPGGVCAQGR